MRKTLMKRMGVASALVLMTLLSACSPSGDTTGDGSGSTGGQTGGDPGTTDGLPTPQPEAVVAPYVGRWESGPITAVFLKDGRAAINNARVGAIPSEIGTYHVNDDGSLECDWIFSGKEHIEASFENGSLRLSIDYLDRTATADEAPNAYNEIYQALLAESTGYMGYSPVGAISGSADPADPNPSQVFSGATVYSGNGIHVENSFSSVEWYDLPYNQIGRYDGYSRADIWLMPNGRFASEMWLWNGVDSNGQANVTHYLLWGKYKVAPGTDALSGDTVSFAYDDGETAAYKFVGGRRYLRTRVIIYHNAAVKPQ